MEISDPKIVRHSSWAIMNLSSAEMTKKECLLSPHFHHLIPNTPSIATQFDGEYCVGKAKVISVPVQRGIVRWLEQDSALTMCTQNVKQIIKCITSLFDKFFSSNHPNFYSDESAISNMGCSPN